MTRRSAASTAVPPQFALDAKRHGGAPLGVALRRARGPH
ncbi:hypothetical protein BDSB_19750 [Burkholderia dolosa PC543]|nr:hypothetical protein BDSB_19750 [Burkholderia dolosa PC543]